MIFQGTLMKKFINGFISFVILLGSHSVNALAAESDDYSNSTSESIKNGTDSGRLHPPLKQNPEMTGINGDTTRMDTNGNGILSTEEARKYEDQEQKKLELSKQIN